MKHMSVDAEIDKLVEELIPYEDLMNDEYGELLAGLLAVSYHKDYFSSDGFADALVKELSAIKTELEENYEIVEREHNRVHKYRELVMK